MDPNAGGRVQSMVAGRLEAGPKGFPALGQTVRKGEVLAYVVPASDTLERANQAAQLAELRASLGDRGGTLYRIRFHRLGDDPRVALRNDAALDSAARTQIAARLARLDAASKTGPWTHRALLAIGANPATLAGRLAEDVGQSKEAFKINVRKLKALGLTESLGAGYRLSPRGEEYLNASPK